MMASKEKEPYRSSHASVHEGVVPTENASGKVPAMFMWALLFFTLSFIAGVVGFAGVAAVSTSVTQMLFFVFLIMTGVTFGSFLMTR